MSTTSSEAPWTCSKTIGEAQHLGCFAGGMVGIGARMFSHEEDMATARKLMEGCLWAYENARGGIMPEILELIRARIETYVRLTRKSGLRG